MHEGIQKKNKLLNSSNLNSLSIQKLNQKLKKSVIRNSSEGLLSSLTSSKELETQKPLKKKQYNTKHSNSIFKTSLIKGQHDETINQTSRVSRKHQNQIANSSELNQRLLRRFTQRSSVTERDPRNYGNISSKRMRAATDEHLNDLIDGLAEQQHEDINKEHGKGGSDRESGGQEQPSESCQESMHDSSGMSSESLRARKEL